jgi:mannose-6-phosphate isomerase-like protein (cupin superfamily)
LVESVDGGTYAVRPYIMQPEHGGLVAPAHFTFALGELTRGAVTPAYRLASEEAFMILEGVLDVEFFDGTNAATQRLGARDLVVVPAGAERRLRNADAGPVRFATIVGDPASRPFGWRDVAVAARR